MMWVLCLLVFGIFSAVHGQNCVLKTLACSHYRNPMEPHKNLKESPAELDRLCSQQEYFYECLEKLLRSYDAESVSVLPSELIASRLLTKELCTEGSPWRKKYLNTAACINRQVTDFCLSPDFLATFPSTGEQNIISRCRPLEKALNCIAVTLVMNCGIDAGNVFHFLLKMSNDGNEDCNSVGLDVLPSCHSSSGNDTQVDMFKEIYNGLLKKIGDIPDEDAHDALVDRYGDSVELVGNARDSKFDLLDRYGDSTESIKEESLSEAIETAMDALEENLEHETSSLDADDREAVVHDTPTPGNEYANEEFLAPKEEVSPDFTYEKSDDDITVVTHRDGRILYYWYFIDDGSVSVDFWTCNHVNESSRHYVKTYWDREPAFQCTIEIRHEEPKCKDPVTYNTTEGIIDPKELDPEFGAKLREKYPSSRGFPYVFLQWDKKSTTYYDFFLESEPTSGSLTSEESETGSGIESAQDVNSGLSSEGELYPQTEYGETVTSTELNDERTHMHGSLPEDSVSYDTSEDILAENSNLEFSSESIFPSEATTLEQLVEVLSTESLPKSETESLVTLEERDDVYSSSESSFDADLPNSSTQADSTLETETTLPSRLFEAVTSASAHKSNECVNYTTVLKQVRREMNLFQNLYNLPRIIHYADGGFTFYWTNKHKSLIKSMVCGRVNECHPKAKDIMKCSITLRNVPRRCRDYESAAAANDQTFSEYKSTEDSTVNLADVETPPPTYDFRDFDNVFTPVVEMEEEHSNDVTIRIPVDDLVEVSELESSSQETEMDTPAENIEVLNL